MLYILLGITGTCVYAVSAMPEENTTVTEETTVAAEEITQELVPMMASGCCYQYWVPDTWNLQYMDQTMAQIVQSNGWRLGPIDMNESNERTQVLYGASGQIIGSYHIDHKFGGRITQSHYHLDGDSTRIHYVVYR